MTEYCILSGETKDMALKVSNDTPLYSKQGKQYILSNKAKTRIGSASRRFNLPLLTASALGLTLYHPIQAIVNDRSWTGVRDSGRILLRNFTGVHFKLDGTTQFNWRWMGNGLLPFALVMLVNRTGVFRSTNARLARAKVPLRFS